MHEYHRLVHAVAVAYCVPRKPAQIKAHLRAAGVLPSRIRHVGDPMPGEKREFSQIDDGLNDRTNKIISDATALLNELTEEQRAGILRLLRESERVHDALVKSGELSGAHAGPGIVNPRELKVLSVVPVKMAVRNPSQNSTLMRTITDTLLFFGMPRKAYEIDTTGRVVRDHTLKYDGDAVFTYDPYTDSIIFVSKQRFSSEILIHIRRRLARTDDRVRKMTAPDWAGLDLNACCMSGRQSVGVLLHTVFIEFDLSTDMTRMIHATPPIAAAFNVAYNQTRGCEVLSVYSGGFYLISQSQVAPLVVTLRSLMATCDSAGRIIALCSDSTVKVVEFNTTPTVSGGVVAELDLKNNGWTFMGVAIASTGDVVALVRTSKWAKYLVRINGTPPPASPSSSDSISRASTLLTVVPGETQENLRSRSTAFLGLPSAIPRSDTPALLGGGAESDASTDSEMEEDTTGK